MGRKVKPVLCSLKHNGALLLNRAKIAESFSSEVLGLTLIRLLKEKSHI